MPSTNTKPALGRDTFCDFCERRKPDCLQMRRERDTQWTETEFMVCAACRVMWRNKGMTLTNIDPEFREKR